MILELLIRKLQHTLLNFCLTTNPLMFHLHLFLLQLHIQEVTNSMILNIQKTHLCTSCLMDSMTGNSMIVTWKQMQTMEILNLSESIVHLVILVMAYMVSYRTMLQRHLNVSLFMILKILLYLHISWQMFWIIRMLFLHLIILCNLHRLKNFQTIFVLFLLFLVQIVLVLLLSTQLVQIISISLIITWLTNGLERMFMHKIKRVIFASVRRMEILSITILA